MFSSEVYVNRRRSLLAQMASRGAQGIAVFLGNVDAATNYRGNDYKFRQDSNFLYFWGVDEPGFAAVLDLDSASECLYGNDVDIDDIIWMGPQPSVASKGAPRRRFRRDAVDRTGGATMTRERRRRDGCFADLGDLRRALAVHAVDRPVAIRLPDGRKFAVADVRLDRESGEPVEDAAVLLIAGRTLEFETNADEANQ